MNQRGFVHFFIALISFFVLNAYAYEYTKLPSYLDSGTFKLDYYVPSNSFLKFDPDDYSGELGFYKDDQLEESHTIDSDGHLQGTYSLSPGVYRARGEWTGYTVEAMGQPASQYQTFSVESRSLTILDFPEAPYQVLPNPAVLNCDTDYNLSWAAVNGVADKTRYKIEERSAALNEAFDEEWITLATNLEATQLNLQPGKNANTKYQYRVSASFVLNGFQSAYGEPAYSETLVKPSCVTTESYSAFVGESAYENSDQLNIAMANESGISVNILNDLTVIGKPLVIPNYARGDESRFAKLIVLQAPYVSLANHIIIDGHSADLLIINTKGGAHSDFNCSNCSFENINRLTLVNGTSSVGMSVSMTEVGRIRTNNQASMSINQLLAPGVISLELLSGNLNTSGFISTNLRGDWNSFGEFEEDFSGTVSAASGVISAYIGGMDVQYSDLELQAVWPRDVNNYNLLHFSDIAGGIETAALNLASTENINLKASISTAADVLVAQNSETNLFVPNEQIKIQSMGRYAQLSVLGALKTLSNINLHAFNKIYIKNSVQSEALTLIAGSKLSVEASAKLSADVIRASAGILENNGSIYSPDIGLEAQYSLINSFGGKVFGRLVKIAAPTGIFRNGSLTPYRSTAEISVGDNDAAAHEAGTYYDLQGSVSQGTKVNDLSAQILGDIVYINAKNVENINPYYVVNKSGEDWSDGVTFVPFLMKQVAIYATEGMRLEGTGKLLNSSAEIVTLLPDSKLEIDFGLVINERYRTDVLYDFTSVTSQGDEADYQPEWEDETLYTTNTAEQATVSPTVYSPPGVIYAAGAITADLGTGLYNKMSFVEILGDAIIRPKASSTVIQSKGVSIHSFEYSVHDDPCKWIVPGGENQSSICGREVVQWGKIQSIGSLDTLFAFHGDLEAPSVNFEVEDQDLFKELVAEATGKTIAQLDNMSESELNTFIHNAIQSIINFIESIKQAILNAWDTLVDWFA